jgi:hypothetical protein
VIKGKGKLLLGKETAEQLKVLQVGPDETMKGTVYTVTRAGSDSDIRKEFGMRRHWLILRTIARRGLLPMLDQKALGLCCYNCKEISGELCRMLLGTFQTLSAATLKLKRKHWLSYGLVNVLIYMCMAENSS